MDDDNLVDNLPCPHVNITASAATTGVTDTHENVIGYNTSFQVWCGDCGEPFVFMGLTPGLSPLHPTSDITATQLNAPVRPSTAAEGFGEGLASFEVRDRVGMMTDQDRHEALNRIKAAIRNPSTVTLRVPNESAESWAARAAFLVMELK